MIQYFELHPFLKIEWPEVSTYKPPSGTWTRKIKDPERPIRLNLFNRLYRLKGIRVDILSLKIFEHYCSNNNRNWFYWTYFIVTFILLSLLSTITDSRVNPWRDSKNVHQVNFVKIFTTLLLSKRPSTFLPWLSRVHFYLDSPGKVDQKRLQMCNTLISCQSLGPLTDTLITRHRKRVNTF